MNGDTLTLSVINDAPGPEVTRWEAAYQTGQSRIFANLTDREGGNRGALTFGATTGSATQSFGINVGNFGDGGTSASLVFRTEL